MFEYMNGLPARWRLFDEGLTHLSVGLLLELYSSSDRSERRGIVQLFNSLFPVTST